MMQFHRVYRKISKQKSSKD